ncbi:hypothetical protein MMC30_004043 [Trapelia coarctata]|nr:hypothetical protein [Trapelia coarctata]
MDPLSITASIIAVLQATNLVVSLIYDYRSAAKSSSWEYPQVISELQSLRNVLEKLTELASNNISTRGMSNSSLSMLTQLCDSNDGALGKCLSELDALKKKLAPPSWSGAEGSKRRALVQAFGWPLKRDETIKTLETIGRFKASLSLALSADQIDFSNSFDPILSNVFTFLYLSHQEITRTAVTHIAGRTLTQNILETTETTQFTALTVREDVRKLNSSLESMKLGKTILASTIIEDVLDYTQKNSKSATDSTGPQAVLYYYFAFNDEDKTVAEKMLCSLISQLLLQDKETFAALEAAFPYDSILRQRPTMDELSDAFSSMLRGLRKAFIVFDALDECTNREELLPFISDTISRKQGNLHLLFTSRRERDIEEAFDGLLGDEDRICIQSALVDDDVRTFIHGRLSNDPKLKRWRNVGVQIEIETTLTDKADGMFRWVECQLDGLGKCLNLAMLRKALASLPKTLDDTYARILQNIDEDYKEYVVKILQWLAFSTRLLQVKEVAEVLAVDAEADPRFDPDRRLSEPKDILEICSSLVSIETQTVVEDVGTTIRIIQGEVIRLAHFSVQEYLVSERIKSGPVSQYSVSKDSANTEIAETSLAYILHLRKPPSLIHRTVEEYPLARYAAESWSQHMRLAGERSAIMDTLIHELFIPDSIPYMNWITLYDHSLASTSDAQATPASAVYYAADTGCVDVVREILDGNIDVDAAGGLHGSALHLAISRRDKKLIQLLVSYGADMNAKSNVSRGRRGCTPLEEALRQSEPGVIEILLRNGAQVRKGNSLDQNLIYAAAIKGAEARIENLSSYKFGRNALRNNIIIPDAAECLRTILQCDPDRWHAQEFREVYFEALQGAHREGEIGAVRLLLHSTSIEVLKDLAEQAEGFNLAPRLINDFLEELQLNLLETREAQATLGRDPDWISRYYPDIITTTDRARRRRARSLHAIVNTIAGN